MDYQAAPFTVCSTYIEGVATFDIFGKVGGHDTHESVGPLAITTQMHPD